MMELNQMLGRPVQKSREGKNGRASVFTVLEEQNWEEEEREERSVRQNTSQREQRDHNAKKHPDSSKNEAGSLPTEKAINVHKKPYIIDIEYKKVAG